MLLESFGRSPLFPVITPIATIVYGGLIALVLCAILGISEATDASFTFDTVSGTTAIISDSIIIALGPGLIVAVLILAAASSSIAPNKCVAAEELNDELASIQ